MRKSSFEEVLEKDGRLVYTNQGDSMLPFIREGRDLLIIERPAGRLKKYDVPLYKRESGRYVLHRIIKVRADGYVVRGDNRRGRESVRDDQILGVLTALVRGGKTIPADSRSYRFRAALWQALYPFRAPYLALRERVKALRRKKKA